MMEQFQITAAPNREVQEIDALREALVSRRACIEVHENARVAFEANPGRDDLRRSYAVSGDWLEAAREASLAAAAVLFERDMGGTVNMPRRLDALAAERKAI